jgi:hypothetical protein
MDKIGTVYDLRSSTAEPTIYLGADIVKHQLPNGSNCWAMSSATYVKNANGFRSMTSHGKANTNIKSGQKLTLQM